MKAIAMYLPQFHPIPENDEWWGKGFTEWTNVAKAKPLFDAHYQPHLPADLGFYDLRLPEAREAQADLARAYGIYGFCYYHYWFKGRRLLDGPIDGILASGKPDFPFCLCWANETWSRTWLGEEKEILIKQEYSEQDDVQHAQWLSNVFADKRYIRHEARPIFLVYSVTRHPDVGRFCESLREACRKRGEQNPYLIGVDAHRPFEDTRPLGFDTTLHFEPQLSSIPGFFSDEWTLRRFVRNLTYRVVSGRMKVYDYPKARWLMNLRKVKHPQIPCVLVGWDNTSRRGERGSILVRSSPESFEAELKRTLREWQSSSPSDDLFFINAWNEWAEGNHLEPDQRFGLRYLEAVKRTFS